MALIVPVAGTARLSIQPPVQVRRPRRLTVFSTLSTQPRGGDAVDWVEATSKFFEQDSRPIMLFDGVCNLCNGGVKFVRDNDRQRSYIKSEAVLKIMEYIDLPFPQLAFFLQFVPLFVRDFAYEKIADNRYSFFGRSESCEI